MKDTDILLLFDNRNEKAIEELTRQYGARLRHTAKAILGNDQDAEECVNDACLKLWNSIPPAMPEHLGAYAEAVVRNAAVDLVRSRRKKSEIPRETLDFADGGAEVPDDVKNVSEIAEDGRIPALISTFLRRIDKDKRRLFVARYYYERSIAEISAKTGIPQGTVMSVLYRTRKALKEYLSAEGVEL